MLLSVMNILRWIYLVDFLNNIVSLNAGHSDGGAVHETKNDN